ncbi:MAG: ATP-binding protein [Thermodesulfobacteriota bacterium]
MFSKRIRDLGRSLSFRLTLWYAGVFVCSTLLLLFLFYYYTAFQIIEDMDDDLGEELTEFTSILAEGGVEAVKGYMVIEVDSEVEDTFFRLLTTDGRELKMVSNISLETGQLLQAHIPPVNKNIDKAFVTVEIPDYPHRLRVLSGVIGKGLVLQVGDSFLYHDQVASIFKRLLLLAVFPLFVLSALIGWFLARQALAGVGEVALIADKIAAGDYNQRVRLKKSHLEIQILADAFNAMLDRIQALIKGMKEVTDNIAHDLRSPLARIRGKAEMTIVGDRSPADYRDMAADTVEECDNLIDMINTMLDITEAEAGVGHFEMETVAVNALVLAACELFEPIAREKGITLTTDLPGAPLFCQGDRHQLQRLITNLIENGIKYNRPGGSVRIRAGAKEGWLCIEVADTGQGIAEADLPRIFDRFYRCDPSRSEPGLGLGLSLAQAIARAAGGDIVVSSVVNEGSRFIVSLPM